VDETCPGPFLVVYFGISCTEHFGSSIAVNCYEKNTVVSRNMMFGFEKRDHYDETCQIWHGVFKFNGGCML
jgi:hypothetical protein